jgi:hypothetical protein
MAEQAGKSTHYYVVEAARKKAKNQAASELWADGLNSPGHVKRFCRLFEGRNP